MAPPIDLTLVRVELTRSVSGVEIDDRKARFNYNKTERALKPSTPSFTVVAFVTIKTSEERVDARRRSSNNESGKPKDRGSNPVTIATDNELLMRFVQAKDNTCFEQLVARHSSMVFRVCNTILSNRHEAEDAYQATFLVLVRKARCLLKVKSLAAWLYRVAWRIAVRASETRRKKAGLTLTEDPQSETDQFHQISKREVLTRVYEELAELPEKYRAVLVDCYLEGRSYREIAAAQDCTETAVKGRIAQAKKVLRYRLLKRGVALTFVLLLLEQVRATSAAVSAQQVAVASSLSTLTGRTAPQVSQAVISLSNHGVSIMKTTSPYANLVACIVAALLIAGIPVAWLLTGSAVASAGEPSGLTLAQEKQSVSESDPFNSPAVKIARSEATSPSVDRSETTDDSLEKRIEDVLSSNADFEFIDTPLREVAGLLADQYNIPVHLDKVALEDSGFDLDLPITGSAKGRKMRAALNFLFDEVDFAVVVKDETMVITTYDAISNQPQKYVTTKIYDLTDFGPGEHAKPIVDLVMANVTPQSWLEKNGGYGSANLVSLKNKNLLVVSQISEHHHQIKKLLDSLRSFSQ